MENYRLSSYAIFTKLKDTEDKYMLVHGYTGAIDIATESIVSCLKSNAQLLQPSNCSFSENTFHALVKRGYITNKTFEDEIEYVGDLAELFHKKDKELILPRHEQGLIHAAEGYARSTGKVGVCLVTSGPGATNLVTGIADANYDGIPLVCFTGQVATSVIGNDAFQEVDIVGITRTICKYLSLIHI